MTERITVEEYRKAHGNEHQLLQLVGDRHKAAVRGNERRRAEKLAQEVRQEREREATEAIREALTETSRGPWTLSITGLGRPPTYNAERTSSKSEATRLRVRELNRAWHQAVAEAAREEGIPALERAFVVIQAQYPDKRVVDPDGLPAMVKSVLDGLVEAAVIPNDRRDELPFSYYLLPPRTDGGDPRVAVTVFALS